MFAISNKFENGSKLILPDTKDDGIAQPNDFTPMSAINQFDVYYLAFVFVCSKVFPNDF